MAAFPTTVATDSDLYIAVNATSTQLTDNPLTAGATTANVVSTTGFPTVGFISIDNEIIKYTGKTGTSFTGLTRGADGTTAASHVQNSQVFHNVIAVHHNALKDDLIATQQFISDIIGRVTTQIKGPDGTASLPGHSFSADTDTGFYRPTSNQISVALGGTALYNFNASSFQLNSGMRIDNQDGAAATPSYTFGTDVDTGIYRAAANSMGFTTNGSVKMTVASTEITSLVKFRIADGSAADPSLALDNSSSTGLYRTGANTIGYSINGTLRFAMDSAAFTVKNAIYNADGTVSAPTYTFENDLDTGIYRVGANNVALSTNGVKTMEWLPNVATDSVTTSLVNISSGAATSNFQIRMQPKTSVSTSATTIIAVGQRCALCFVNGSDGTNRFADLVFTASDATTFTVLASITNNGSPAARTYSIAGDGNLKLAMAAGTYTITALIQNLSQ